MSAALSVLAALAVGLILVGVMAWLLREPPDDGLALEEKFPGEWDVWCRRCGALFADLVDLASALATLRYQRRNRHSCAEHRAEQRAQHQRERDEEDRDERGGWAA